MPELMAHGADKAGDGVGQGVGWVGKRGGWVVSRSSTVLGVELGLLLGIGASLGNKPGTVVGQGPDGAQGQGALKGVGAGAESQTGRTRLGLVVAVTEVEWAVQVVGAGTWTGAGLHFGFSIMLHCCLRRLRINCLSCNVHLACNKYWCISLGEGSRSWTETGAILQ